MRALDIANIFIIRHGNDINITNLSLNKLVYFAQVESLRSLGRPLFSDSVEAWDYGPVEPSVYHAFKHNGRSVIHEPSAAGDCVQDASSEAVTIVDEVAEKYGSLTAFDLVEISHRRGGAWRNKYARGRNTEITIGDIVDSADFASEPDLKRTFFAGVVAAEKKWPNTLRMLGDA